MEWSLRGSHPLAGPGIPLSGVLTIDMPCLQSSGELLDAMAEANDIAVGFAETSEALKAEFDHLSQRVRDHVGKFHSLIGEDLAQGIRDPGPYVASLETQFADRIIYLYPDRSGEAEGYKPGRHVRELLKSIRHEARRASRSTRPGQRIAHRPSVGHAR